MVFIMLFYSSVRSMPDIRNMMRNMLIFDRSARFLLVRLLFSGYSVETKLDEFLVMKFSIFKVFVKFTDCKARSYYFVSLSSGS